MGSEFGLPCEEEAWEAGSFHVEGGGGVALSGVRQGLVRKEESGQDPLEEVEASTIAGLTDLTGCRM